MEGYPSGQRGQAVNLLAYAYGGSNPPPSSEAFGRLVSPSFRGNSSVGRASAFQAEGREFEPRFPLHDQDLRR
jgi:hypothetical protein